MLDAHNSETYRYWDPSIFDSLIFLAASQKKLNVTQHLSCFDLFKMTGPVTAVCSTELVPADEKVEVTGWARWMGLHARVTHQVYDYFAES